MLQDYDRHLELPLCSAVLMAIYIYQQYISCTNAFSETQKRAYLMLGRVSRTISLPNPDGLRVVAHSS
jgi:hypothetical protein